MLSKAVPMGILQDLKENFGNSEMCFSCQHDSQLNMMLQPADGQLSSAEELEKVGKNQQKGNTVLPNQNVQQPLKMKYLSFMTLLIYSLKQTTKGEDHLTPS